MDFLTSSEDSEVTLSSSFKPLLQERYRGRCAVCLQDLPPNGGLCARLVDTSQVSTAAEDGVLKPKYNPEFGDDDIYKCPTCHLSYFTTGLVAFSLPLPVLQYILRYILTTPKSERKPLYKVFHWLGDWRARFFDPEADALPDSKSIAPYIGLFSLVILNQDSLNGMNRRTSYLPPLSILKDGRFNHAPAGISPSARNVARIFDALTFKDGGPEHGGSIPLSPADPTFQEARYWQIPVKMEAILVALQEQAGRKAYASEEVTLTQNIFYILALQRSYEISVTALTTTEPWSSGPDDSDDTGSSAGPSEHGDGAGPSDDEPPKRKRQRNDDGDKGSQKRQGKAGAADVEEARDPGSRGENDLKDESRPPPHDVSPLADDWGVASSRPDEDEPSVGLGVENRDQPAFGDDGPEPHPTWATPPPDQHQTWRFGPSRNTFQNIFQQRAVLLS